MAQATGIRFRNYPPFGDAWSGFERIERVNVVIGRNNSGKSKLLDLVAFAASDKRNRPHTELRTTADANWSRSVLRSRDPTEIVWYYNGGGKPTFLLNGDEIRHSDMLQALASLVNDTQLPLAHREVVRLEAERDLIPEPEESVGIKDKPGTKGELATNIVRDIINSANRDRELVQTKVLNGLNSILGGEFGRFEEITIRQHPPDSNHNRSWEIYLLENSKGLIKLSDCGGGIRTLLLVLLNLIVVPSLEPRRKSYAFCFEELENGLHPGLLRRLLRYIENHAQETDDIFFLTTHSPVTLDVFSGTPNAQIVRVTHDGKTAKTETVSHEFQRHSVLGDLGAKPSDLLQANGIVWVEGPSDAIYLNAWISVMSDGELREGRDYQCAFYGGALLSHVQARAGTDAEKHLVNLFAINPNFVVICDSDRSATDDELKPRVSRMVDQAAKVPSAYIWVTGAREIENYLTAANLTAAIGSTVGRSPEQFERFWPSESAEGFWVKETGKKSFDKISLARSVVSTMQKEDLEARFDWSDAMTKIVSKIKDWNA